MNCVWSGARQAQWIIQLVAVTAAATTLFQGTSHPRSTCADLLTRAKPAAHSREKCQTWSGLIHEWQEDIRARAATPRRGLIFDSPLLFSLPPPTPHPLPPLQPHPLSANQGSLVEMLTPPTLAAGWFFRCILSLVQSLSSIFSSSLFVSPDIPLFRLPSCCARMHLCSRNHLTHRWQGYLLVVMFPWQWVTVVVFQPHMTKGKLTS